MLVYTYAALYNFYMAIFFRLLADGQSFCQEKNSNKLFMY